MSANFIRCFLYRLENVSSYLIPVLCQSTHQLTPINLCEFVTVVGKPSPETAWTLDEDTPTIGDV
jgi:hypothetical protein